MEVQEDSDEKSVPIWERQVTTVIDAVEKEQIPRAQYGALLIDEGHDFEADWLKLVTQMIDPEKDSLLLLYDDAQSIYKKQRDKKDRLIIKSFQQHYLPQKISGKIDQKTLKISQFLANEIKLT